MKQLRLIPDMEYVIHHTFKNKQGEPRACREWRFDDYNQARRVHHLLNRHYETYETALLVDNYWVGH